MTDPFENRLTSLFEEAGAFSDEAAFVLRFERRMERQARVRNVLLWCAGSVGAAIAVAQGVGSDLGDRASDFGAAVANGMAALLNDGSASATLQPPDFAAIAFVVGLMALFLIALRAPGDA